VAVGGISPLQYSWDFDNSDGLQEDATGQRVVHVFRKESPTLGNSDPKPYIVTLTVSDVSGAKKPERRTVAADRPSTGPVRCCCCMRWTLDQPDLSPPANSSARAAS
jgi:hypothetical protein